MAEVASAYVSLMPSAKGFGSKLSGEISGDVTSAGKKAGSVFGKVFAAGSGLLAAAGLKTLFSESMGEAREAQKVGALTESIIKSTGKAAGITADQVGDMAGRLSSVTGIDDEVIQQGSNLLLTFKNVKNYVDGEFVGVFDRATASAVDLSAAGFGSVDGAAKMLGKALNDPLKGISALGRAGVTFTAAQQKQIKALVETGDAAKAQGLILAEVESQVGGAAAATATAGDKAAVAAGNLKEQIGTALLPVVDRVATSFTTKIVPAISSFITGMQTGAGAGGRFAAAFVSLAASVQSATGFISRHKTAMTALAVAVGTVVAITKIHAAVLAVQAVGGLVAALKATKTITAATKAYAAVQWLLNAALTANPIGLVIVALVALGAGLVLAYKKSQTFRDVVDGAFEAVKSGATALANFVTKTIPAAFESVLSFVRGIPGKIAAIFTGAASIFYNAGTQLMGQLAAGIAAKIGDAIAAAQAGLSRLKGLLPGSPIKWGPLKNWNNGGAGKRLMELVAKGITSATPKTVKAAKSAFEKIQTQLETTRDNLKSTLDGLKGDFASIKDSVASAFTGNLFNVDATEAKDAVFEMIGGKKVETQAAVAARSVGQNFVAGLMGKRAELSGLLTSFNTLKGWGVDPGFLTQLFASGNGGLITELAGMGQEGALSTAGLFGEVTNLGAQLGTAVASNDNVALRIDETNRLLTIATEQLSYLSSDIGKELNQAASKAQRDKKKRGKK